MSMTEQDRHWHERYKAMPNAQREMVNDAYREVRITLRNEGLSCIGDDRAERLVAAIARFVIECNP